MSRARVYAGDVVELTVEKGVYRGLGLARHASGVVFVRRALPGDRLRARVQEVRSGYAWAVGEELLAPGDGRRPSPCPFFARCGGCAYQELDYPAQLVLKAGILRESLERAGVRWAADVPIQPSPEEGWRTRAAFHCAPSGAGWALGLHEEGSHRVVDLPRCLHLSDAATHTLSALRTAIGGRPEIARRLSVVELAESVDGTGRVACLEGSLRPSDAPRTGGLLDGVAGLTGAGMMVSRGTGRRFLPLRGQPHVYATVLGLRLQSHIRSFFQANRFLIEDLTRAVVDAVPVGAPVVDLYAGVGLFSLPLAARGEDVTAIEWNRDAADDANANVKSAGLDSVHVLCDDVQRGLASCRAQRGETIILDPPRSGAGAELVKAIAGRAPAVVVYVSCDPPTLGRDLRAFEAEGYRPRSIRAYDLFPDTFHLEVLVQLGR